MCTHQTSTERCTKCEAQDCGPLFKCSVTKHLKECKNGYSLTGKVSLDLNHVILRFDDSIWRERGASFSGSEGRNAKEVPEMTQEEVIGLKDLDDAFVLAQAEKDAQYQLLETLDTSHTEV